MSKVTMEEIRTELTGDSSKLRDALGTASDATKKFFDIAKGGYEVLQKVNDALDKVGTTARRSGMALGASLVGSGLGAAKLEKQLRNVMTVSDRSAVSIGSLSKEILSLQLDNQLPNTATDLAEGLYDVTSSGFQGADALKVLEAAAKGAAAGLTSTEVSGRGISAVLNAYGKEAGDAAGVSDTLFQTVNVGVLTFEQLSNNIGEFVPLAASLGVSLEEATAALATMTRTGTNANISTTQLARIFTSFLNPTEKLKKAMKELGYESTEAALRQMGLKGAIEAIIKKANGSQSAIFDLVGNVDALNGVLQLGSQQGRLYGEVFDQINDPMNRAGATQRAFEEQSKALLAELNALKNNLVALGITFGEYVIPTLRSGTEMALTFMRGVMGIADAMGPLKGLLLGVLGSTAGLLIMAKSVIGIGMAFKLLWTLAMKVKVLRTVVDWITLSMKRFTVETTSATLAQTRLGAAIMKVKSVVLALQAAAAIMAASFMAATMVIGAFQKSTQDGRQAAEELVSALNQEITMKNAFESTGDAVLELTSKIEALRKSKDVMDTPWEFFRGGTQLANPFEANGLVEATAELQAYYDALAEIEAKQRNMSVAMGILELSPGFDDLEITMEKLPEMLDAAGFSVDQFIKKMGQAGGAEEIINSLKGFKEETTGALAGQSKLNKLIEEFSDVTKNAADRVTTYGQIVDEIFGQMDIRNATARAGEALRNVGEVLKENGFTLDAWTLQGANVQGMMSELQENAKNLAVATYKQSDSTEAATGAVKEYIDGIRAAARESGLSEQQIDEMIKAMELTPENLKTLVEVENADPAKVKLDEIYERLEDINAYHAKATVDIQVIGSRAASITGDLGGINVVTTPINRNPPQSAPVVRTTQAAIRNNFVEPAYDPTPGGGPGNAIADVPANVNPSSPVGKDSGKGKGGGASSANDSAIKDIEDAMYRAGLVGYDKYLEILKGRIDKTKKYSKEWIEALEEMRQAVAAHEDQMYQDGHTSTAKYLEQLRERLKSVGLFTDEFIAIVDQMAQVQIDHDRRMYEHDLITTEDYKKTLQTRLEQLEKYSAAWFDILDEIERVNQESNDKAIDKVAKAADKRIRVLEKNLDQLGNLASAAEDSWRSAQAAADDALGAFQQEMEEFRNGIKAPIEDALDMVSKFGGALGLNANDIRLYFDQYKDAVTKWESTAERLKNSSIDKGLVEQLLMGGPQSIGLAEALLQMAPEEVNQYLEFFKAKAKAAEDMFSPAKEAELMAKYNVQSLQAQAAASKAAFDTQRLAYEAMAANLEKWSEMLSNLTVEGIPALVEALGLSQDEIGDLNIKQEDNAKATGEATDAVGTLASAIGTDLPAAVTDGSSAMDIIGARVINFKIVADQATASVQALSTAISQIGEMKAPQSYGTGAVKRFSTGGDFGPGTWAWVGENGKELVNFGGQGGRVYPNHSRPVQLASGARSNTFTATVGDIVFQGVTSTVTKADVKEVLEEVFEDIERKINQGVRS